jgi:crossover junction endodeoxyribonuclease RuvC
MGHLPVTRIIGLDLSLASTGAAVIDTAVPGPAQTRRVLVKARAVKRGDPPHTITERSTRLRRLAGDTTTLCVGADLVLVEGPTYSSDTGKAHDRAGYWWLVVARLTGAGLNVVEVSPTALKVYALGKGAGAGTGKDDVLAAVVRRYLDVAIGNNDEADALVLAAMGARFTGHPIEEKPLAQTHLRAMDSVRWTP